MLSALDPALKIDYQDQDPVMVRLNGPTSPAVFGRILGRATAPDILDYWIVLLDEPLPDYPYSAVSVPHIFLQRA